MPARVRELDKVLGLFRSCGIFTFALLFAVGVVELCRLGGCS